MLEWKFCGIIVGILYNSSKMCVDLLYNWLDRLIGDVTQR
jgi:hypothetical protein